MEVIKADYVGMIDNANKLGHLSSKMMAEIDRLKYVVNDIDIFWEGEANSAFHLAMNEDFAVMEALCLKIRMSSKLLKTAVNDYVGTEKELGLIIGG